MDWLQSSLSSHVSKDDAESSFHKGYKNTTKKCSDPNKSETPLLFESPPCVKNEDSDWMRKSLSGESPVEKAGMFQNISNKAGFLGCSIFEKGNTKSKLQSDRSYSIDSNIKVTENKTLLSKSASQTEQISDDESDDEWCLPRSGGYQKVKSSAY